MWAVPTLLTRISASGAVAISAAAPSAVAMSAAMPVMSASGAAWRICRTASSTRASVRPLTTTAVPARAKPTAAARPIPAVEPVMMAFRPLRSMIMFFSFAYRWSERVRRVRAGGAPLLSVDLDQILEDQAAPAIPVSLHKQATFRKPAKLDRREAEIARERSNLLGSSVVVAREEHHPPAPLDGRILVEDRSDQVVEPLDQFAAGEGLSDDLGGRLPAQFLVGHAVRVGHVDDDLPLPTRQRLRDIRVRPEPDSQEDDVRLDGFRERFGSDPGSDRGRG